MDAEGFVKEVVQVFNCFRIGVFHCGLFSTVRSSMIVVLLVIYGKELQMESRSFHSGSGREFCCQRACWLREGFNSTQTLSDGRLP